MSKFSLVIPTMWRYAPFVDFLKHLVELDLVGEIIIIDNDITKTPKDQILHHPKINWRPFPVNTYVNPAWNYGAKLARFETLCIVNDDIIYDLKIFQVIADFMSKGKIAVINLNRDTSSITGEIKLEPYYENMPMLHFGSMMFMSTSDWLDIDNQLLIACGDNWIWETMMCRYHQNYVIQNLVAFTPESVTLKSGISGIYSLDEEYRAFYDEFKKFRQANGCYLSCKTGFCPAKNIG